MEMKDQTSKNKLYDWRNVLHLLQLNLPKQVFPSVFFFTQLPFQHSCQEMLTKVSAGA